jgi:hypothetical protein
VEDACDGTVVAAACPVRCLERGVFHTAAATTSARHSKPIDIALPIGAVVSTYVGALGGVLASSLEALNGANMLRYDTASETAMTTTLSFAEEQLWLAERAGTQASPFFDCAPTLSIAVRIEHALRREALKASLEAIVQRHDVLRSRFVVRHQGPVRRIHPSAAVKLSMVDPRQVDERERSACAEQTLASHVIRRFDLARGPLLRALLVALWDEEHVLAIAVHHIVFDRWSRHVLAQELGRFYEADAAGRTSDIEPLPARYRDYVAWQRMDGELGRKLTPSGARRFLGRSQHHHSFISQ